MAKEYGTVNVVLLLYRTGWIKCKYRLRRTLSFIVSQRHHFAVLPIRRMIPEPDHGEPRLRLPVSGRELRRLLLLLGSSYET
jgi:hypothetical protein